MASKSYQLLQEEAQERYELSREGKPEARRGRSRQRAPFAHKPNRKAGMRNGEVREV